MTAGATLFLTGGKRRGRQTYPMPIDKSLPLKGSQESKLEFCASSQKRALTLL